MNGDISILRPLWLLALPVLICIGWRLWKRQTGMGDWERAADPAMIHAMAVLGRVEAQSGRSQLWLGLSAVGLCIVALSGPALERRDTLSFRNLDGVLFVVDTSRSVMQDPGWPQMLGLGRLGLASLGTRPGGIIVYAGDAYLASGMTLDHLQLGQSFSLIGEDLVPDAGSRPGRALDLAIKRLEDAQIIAGDVVVFTDGAGFGPETLKQAAKLSEIGARLSFVALDEVSQLTTHAQAGQGRVFGPKDAEAFGDWVSQDLRTRLERQDYPLIYWRDMGRFILIFAALPMLLLFRRQSS